VEAGRAALEEIALECAGTEVGESANDLLGLLDQPEMWSDPKDIPPRLLGSRASFYWSVDRELAARAFCAIIDQYPDFRYGPIILFTLGEHFFRQQDYEAAAAEFALMGELYPGSPDTLDGLRGVGLSHGKMENWDEQIAAYKELIARYPGSNTAAVAQRGIGRIYEVALGDVENARAAYEKVLVTYPGTRPACDAQMALAVLGMEEGTS
jgi:TolA-binding protein